MKENILKFTVDTKDLDWALRNVKPYADPRATTPVLRNLRVRVGKNVVIDATDRYAVGQARVERADEDFSEPAEFLLPADSLTVILPTLKTIHGVVVVSVEDGHVSFGGTRVSSGTGDFPSLDRSWPGDLPEDPEPYGVTQATAKKLAAYKPIDRTDKDQPWKVFAGKQGKPYVLLRNSNFRALVMGAKIPDREDVRSEYGTW